MSAIYFKGLFAKLLPTSGIEFSDSRVKTQTTGNPNGSITAPVGSECTDISSGNLYLKLSGSGNTGWVAIPVTTPAAPTGTIISHINFSLTDYLYCDGSAVSRSTYSSLHSAMPKSSATVTMTIASPCVVTWTSNELTTGSQIQFSTTGALPTGITAGTIYFVRVVSGGSTFNLFTSLTAAMNLESTSGIVNTSGSQSGVHTATTYFYGNGDGSTTFNVPDLRGLTPRGIGQTVAFTGFNPTIGIGEITNDQFQGWQLGATQDGTGLQNYYGRVGSRDTTNNSSAQFGFTDLYMQTLAQGSALQMKAVDNGINGAPRTGSETRTKSLGVYFLIKT